MKRFKPVLEGHPPGASYVMLLPPAMTVTDLNRRFQMTKMRVG